MNENEKNVKGSTGKNSTDKNLTRRDFLAASAIGGAILFAENAEARQEPSNDKNMNEPQPNREIDFLQNYPTTVLESAISLLTGTHDNIVLTRAGNLARRTSGGRQRLVGYAATSTFSTDALDERGKRENIDYWNYVFKQPNPKIAISVDASREPATGSSWGQLNAHIHRALGCRGVLTNGGVRDIGEFERLNFEVYSGALTIGHGNPHFLSFGEPVTLYGARVSSGDVVVADEHGAIVIAAAHLPNIAEAAAEIKRRVALVADYCRSPDFAPAGLLEATKRMKPATDWKPGS